VNRLGYSPEELARSPYARYFNPQMAPLPAHVLDALSKGCVARELLPPVAEAARLQQPGHTILENGYTIMADGSARIACLTKMPRVTPEMWDWWFAWHGSEGLRYKLWHPLAHVDVGWADGRSDLAGYVGRTSNIVEYLGSACLNIRLRFVPPGELGFDESALAASGEVVVCARGGLAGLPFDAVWLVHHIRPVAGGAEMRSRFWIFGENVCLRGLRGGLGRAIGLAVSQTRRQSGAQAAELLIHCAQEMNHLAAFLPDLYAEFGPASRRTA
jgi:hypothetical protein